MKSKSKETSMATALHSIESKILDDEEAEEEESLKDEEVESEEESDEMSEDMAEKKVDEDEEAKDLLAEELDLLRSQKMEEIGSEESQTKKKKEKEILFKWWIKPSITYSFRHPLVTSRLEKLMGSNNVQVIDRDYMQLLQQRILEVHAASAEKRIKQREYEEMERVKNLVLTGKVPLSEASPEMYDHPIMAIERHCRRLIAERRAKIKVPKVNIPNHLYWDDTMDAPGGLSIEKGHSFRKESDGGGELRVCCPPERLLLISDENDIANGYMLTPEMFETLRYQDPSVKAIDQAETINELYELADHAVGALKTLKDEDVKPKPK